MELTELVDIVQFVAGAIVSLALSLLPLIPALNQKWLMATDAQKQGVNIAATLLVAGGIYLLSCGGYVALPCDSGLFMAVGNALAGNALTFVSAGKMTKTAAGKAAEKIY